MWPVMKLAASEATKMIAAATSSGVTDPLLRVEGREIGLALGAARETIEHAGVDRAGRDRVDPHPGSGRFERDRLGQALDRVLAGRVDRGARAALMPKGRGDVDDGRRGPAPA